MARPRRPFGPNPPGRLPATMVKVLAAELSDQGRLARGKRYWSDHAVTDIVIGHGAVTAEIQGSRPEPYIVTIMSNPGSGVPAKRDVTVRCTCPDDGIYDACKHAVAALFSLSDEVAIEPDLIERWRGGPAQRGAIETAEPATPATPASTPDERPERSGLAEVVPIRRDRNDAGGGDRRPAPRPPEPPEPPDPTVDEIARMLAPPNGSIAPEFPEVTPLDHAGIRQRQLADVLADALRHLAVDWG